MQRTISLKMYSVKINNLGKSEYGNQTWCKFKIYIWIMHRQRVVTMKVDTDIMYTKGIN